MTDLSICLLGGFRADLDGVPITDFKSDKARALLAFLAVESNRYHMRDALAWLLWPDSPDQAARTSLRSTLANLRKVISDARTSPCHLLINRENIRFNTDSDYWLDVTAFLSAPTKNMVDAAYIEHLEKAVALYQGPFLSGFSLGDSAPFEEWVVLKREEINRHLASTLCCLADIYEQDCRFDKAEISARKMVEVEPWNEEAHRRLMRVLAFGGKRSAALAQYEACRRTLAKELNVEPSQDTAALSEAIRDGRLTTLSPHPNLQATLLRIASVKAGQPPFAGRQAELEKLGSYLKKTLAGNGQVAFVTGSSGIGKTALISEFVRRSVQTSPHLIAVSGGCNAYTGIGDPYLPFMEIVGQLTGDIEAKFPGGVISPQHAQSLFGIFPVFSQILIEIGQDLVDWIVPGKALVERAFTSNNLYGAWQQNLKTMVESRKGGKEIANLQQPYLFEQFTKALLALARQNPLILVLDDLQWADIGSINLLFHLSRRISDSRILIIGAFRPEDIAIGRNGSQHPMEPVLLEFQRGFGEIEINLDQSDGKAFLEAFLNSEQTHLNPVLRTTLFNYTAGHPLFTIELLRSLQEDGELVRDNAKRWTASTLSRDRLPKRVQAVIAERVGRLPQELKRVLSIASVDGYEFTAEVVAEVLDVDEEILVQQLSVELEGKHNLVTAIQSRIVGGQRISSYRFQHHLFQMYFYEALDNIEQAYLHDKVGKTLERFYREYPEELDTIAVNLARHFEKAGIFQKAIDYLQISGKRAERLSASDEAITHYRHALALCSDLPKSIERMQTEITLSMALGAQLVTLGGYSSEEVVQIYARANLMCKDLAIRLNDSHQAALQLIPVLLELGAFHGHRAHYQSAHEIYAHILSLAQDAGDPHSMMLANWGPGYLLVTEGQFLSARCHLEKALKAYELYKHEEATTIFTLDMGVSCLSWLSWALFFLGYPDQALLRSREAVALAREISHPLSYATALVTASILQSMMLNAKGTQELAEEAIAICREKGFLYWFSVATTYHGLALAWQDEHEEGISRMREGEQVWRASGAHIGLADYLIVLAQVLGDAGRVEEGLEVLGEAFEMIQKSGEMIYAAELHRTKGMLLLKLSDDNQVQTEACFREAIMIASNQQAKILELRATTSLCKLLASQGRQREAREILKGIYGWFTEGFQDQDLKLASNLLVELY